MPSSAPLPAVDSHVATLHISSHISSRNLLAPTQGTVGFHFIPAAFWEHIENTVRLFCWKLWCLAHCLWVVVITRGPLTQHPGSSSLLLHRANRTPALFCLNRTETSFFLNYEDIWKHFPMEALSYLNFLVGYDWLLCHSEFCILVGKERLEAPVASHLILTSKAVFFLFSYVH